MSERNYKLLKINKKVEYALMALKFMASKEEGALTSAREVCDNFGAPFDTMAKVMQSLNNKEVLSSVKGIKGGYILQKPLKEITFQELSEIIEGRGKSGVCQTANKTCDLYSVCNIKGPVEKLNEHVNQFLKELTLEKLLFEDIEENKLEIYQSKMAQMPDMENSHE